MSILINALIGMSVVAVFFLVIFGLAHIIIVYAEFITDTFEPPLDIILVFLPFVLIIGSVLGIAIGVVK